MNAEFTGLLVVGLMVTTRTLSLLIRSIEEIRPRKTSASRDKTVTCGIGISENGGVNMMSNRLPSPRPEQRIESGAHAFGQLPRWLGAG